MQPSVPAFTGLLDTYSGAAVAYSAARRLATAYTGALIRVRRSSDNTEQDIGYDSNNVLDESALTTFVGAGDGFVTTWYDQSGNARNITQSTASYQPKIVNSGSIIKYNNKPTLTFDGSNDLFKTPQFSYSTALSVYYVTQRVGTGSTYSPDISIQTTDNTDQGAFHYINGSLQGASYPFANNFATYDGFGTYANGDKYLINFDMTNSSGYSVYRNNSLEKSVTTSGTINSLAKGFVISHQVQVARYSNNNFCEVIMWLTNQSSNRTSINSDINTFYSIY